MQLSSTQAFILALTLLVLGSVLLMFSKENADTAKLMIGAVILPVGGGMLLQRKEKAVQKKKQKELEEELEQTRTALVLKDITPR